MIRIICFLILFVAPVIARADVPINPVKEELLAVDIDQLLERITIDPFQERIPKPPEIVPPPQAVVAPPVKIITQVQQIQPVAKVIVEKPSEPLPIKKPNFVVEGIIWSDTIHQAVVSGQLITIGDRIADAVVVDINRDGVIVDVRGSKFTIPVQ